MKRSKVGAAIHWTRLVLLALLLALAVGVGIGKMMDHKYGQGAGFLVAAVIVAAPTALLRWYPQALSFGAVDKRPKVDQ